MINDELESTLRCSVDLLPNEFREIFFLSRFENMKYEEIAIKKGILVNTVKTQIKIALQKMRQTLAPYIPAMLTACIMMSGYIRSIAT